MKISEQLRATILETIRRKGLSNTELAQGMGHGKPWVTKLLNGTLKTLDEEQVSKLEVILGLSFFSSLELKVNVSPVMKSLAERAEGNPELSEVLLKLDELTSSAVWLPRYIETKDMTRIGQEIIKLCFANEDKPGKVAREVLKLLS